MAHKKIKARQVNSLAYCAQAVHEEAEVMAKGGALRKNEPVKAPFQLEELTKYLLDNAAHLREKHEAYRSIAQVLENLASDAEKHYSDLEELEQRLTALEEKMSAIARAAQSEEALFEARRQLDLALRPYRGKMTADQLSMLERQFLERNVLEERGLTATESFLSDLNSYREWSAANPSEVEPQPPLVRWITCCAWRPHPSSGVPSNTEESA